ncbi:Chloroperoxidase [Paraphoma chrysanthemicola]|nr:Chloroperoxidase [Paraphoma chrysanthemicola]
MVNSFIILLVALLSTITAFPHYVALIESHDVPKDNNKDCGLVLKHFAWKAPGPNDLRSPCPVMNTLANHDFVPRSGRNITRDPFVAACGEALNISPEFANGIFTSGVPSNPIPNATFFDLNMLDNTTGFIEHDGSLSRADVFFDKDNDFSPKVFDNFISYFNESATVDIALLANARARHAFDMSLANPTFVITNASIPVILGENAMLLSIFSNNTPLVNPVARRDWIEYFFRNERLPVELGWSPVKIPIGEFVGVVIDELIAQTPADVPLVFNDPASATV